MRGVEQERQDETIGFVCIRNYEFLMNTTKLGTPNKNGAEMAELGQRRRFRKPVSERIREFESRSPRLK